MNTKKKNTLLRYFVFYVGAMSLSKQWISSFTKAGVFLAFVSTLLTRKTVRIFPTWA